MNGGRWAVVLALTTVLQVACRPATVTTPTTVVVNPPPAPVEPKTEAAAPSILSAHLEALDLKNLGQQDSLPVLFSSDLDAASLDAEAFMVMFSDGTRAIPTEARLAPASENDENRTVVLVGDFGEPTEKPPTDVMVVGRLYSELGESFEGLVAKVEPYESPGRVVLAQRVPTDWQTCQGLGQAVRLFWIDALRGVEAADLIGVKVTLADGTVATPVKFDDHDLEDQRTEDNVLDVCLTESSPARSVEVAQGLFEDPAGHPNAAVSVEIGALPQQ